MAGASRRPSRADDGQPAPRSTARDGHLLVDSWQLTGPTYQLRDPSTQRWTKDAARALDRGFNAIVGAEPLDDFVEPVPDRLRPGPKRLRRASHRHDGEMRAQCAGPDARDLRRAPRSTADVLLVTHNDRAFTRTVRKPAGGDRCGDGGASSRCRSCCRCSSRGPSPGRSGGWRSPRTGCGSAGRARCGCRACPRARDEIGLLARAVSDMSQSLRQRIDEIEAFAADVTHELKNPLASLRSAVDGLERVEDPELKRRLLDIAREDVCRLDRLISDITEAARTDAELARAPFEPVDLGQLIEQLVASWESRRDKGDARIAFARPRMGTAVVMGEPDRLARAIDAIIDNAISFSPPGGLVEIAAARVGDEVRVRIEDEGPGVPGEAREAIFNRFHSVRPEGEDFGRHSGLGLAIAQAIVEGHDGEIDVQDRDDAPSGARFIIRLPAADRA